MLIIIEPIIFKDEHVFLEYKINFQITTSCSLTERYRAIMWWNDFNIDIQWPYKEIPTISSKDKLATSLSAARILA